MKNLGTSYGIKKKVFLKDQLVDDGDKVYKGSSSIGIPIRIDPIIPPTMYANHGVELRNKKHCVSW